MKPATKKVKKETEKILQQWEYHVPDLVFRFDTPTQRVASSKEMQKVAEGGWELFELIKIPTGFAAVFRKPH